MKIENEVKARSLVIIGFIVGIVTAFLWQIGVPFVVCLPSFFMAAIPACIGFFWLCIESLKGADSIKEKMTDAASCGFLGLLMLEFVVHFSTRWLFSFELPWVIDWYAAPLVTIYVLGCVGYVFAWLKNLYQKFMK